MALRNILTEGEKILSKRSRPVEVINERIIQLLDDMRETLEAAEGAGLAAPQVGILRRVILVENEGEVLELINPEIIECEGEQEGLEGCLSIPGKYGMLKRPLKVAVKALDRNGNEFIVSGEEMTARGFCHEIDHLEGVLFNSKARMLTDEELEEWKKKHCE
jgi:peptide deformylase